ncbi:MAG: hypothetical protein ACI8ZF_000561 [Candidatus Midichloriaceae bacterium]|jgi:hypothetical protein
MVICADTNIQTDKQEEILEPIYFGDKIGTTLKKDGSRSDSAYDRMFITKQNDNLKSISSGLIESMMSSGTQTAKSSISDHYGLGMVAQTKFYNQPDIGYEKIPQKSATKKLARKKKTIFGKWTKKVSQQENKKRKR